MGLYSSSIINLLCSTNYTLSAKGENSIIINLLHMADSIVPLSALLWNLYTVIDLVYLRPF